MSAELEVARLVATLSSLGGVESSIEFRAGTILLSTDLSSSARPWTVVCGGNTVAATWSQGITPYDGAPCVLALITVDNKSTYHVMYVANSQPAVSGVATVTAFSAGAATCTVSQNGNTYTVQRAASYTPTVGDTVVVQTIAGQSYVFQPLTVYVQPTPTQSTAPAPPPSAPTTGNSPIPAGDSGTFTPAYGVWNSYYGQDLAQGDGYVPESEGYWFYNGGTLGLASKTTLTRIGFWIPPRMQAGAYNNTQTLHIYTHNASYKGGGEPSRVDGPFDVAIPPYFGGGWVNLPTSFAGTLKAGGGIAIAGDPYIVMQGVGRNGQSGALSVDWSM